MNLGTSYILWDYPSAVPYMWLQNTFVATLDPVAALGRLLSHSGLSSASSQLLPRGWFPPGSCRLWFVLPLLCSPLPPVPLPCCWAPGLLQKLGMWHRVGWHCPPWLGMPQLLLQQSFRSLNSLGAAEEGSRKWPIAMSSGCWCQVGKDAEILSIRDKQQLRSWNNVETRLCSCYSYRVNQIPLQLSEGMTSQ